MATLTICDERLGQGKEKALTLECFTEKLTVRELIRQRIYQEVQDYNLQIEQKEVKLLPKLLVTPVDAEIRLNAKSSKIADYKAKKRNPINWQTQFDLACTEFQRNGFFILIGDRQAETLDEPFEVAVDTDITFVKLVQLVGG